MPGQLIRELDSNTFPLSTLNPVKVLLDEFQNYFFIHIGSMWNFETQFFFFIPQSIYDRIVSQLFL